MLIRRVIDQIRAYRRYRTTVEQLSMLSDRELLDIGITRREIISRARG